MLAPTNNKIGTMINITNITFSAILNFAFCFGLPCKIISTSIIPLSPFLLKAYR